jgi:hypothetical protein
MATRPDFAIQYQVIVALPPPALVKIKICLDHRTALLFTHRSLKNRVSPLLFADNFTLWYDIVWDGPEGKNGYSSLSTPLKVGGGNVHTNDYN